MGAGSGILSVVAERFGAKSALAIDNDPECWRECEKMFKINRAKKCTVNTKQSGAITQKYDVVIANIIDGVLIEIKNHLHRMTKDGGYIILSGILTDGAPAFEKSFLKGFGGKVVLRLSDTEWTSLLISK